MLLSSSGVGSTFFRSLLLMSATVPKGSVEPDLQLNRDVCFGTEIQLTARGR